MMVSSGPSVREVPDVTIGDHFGRVAAVYESLRTTDEAPVRAIGQFLPDRPVTGLDAGCGTGRYSRLLGELLPAGSLLAATDVSAAMLAPLTARTRGHAPAGVPLLATPEELPFRATRPRERTGPSATSLARLPRPEVSWVDERLLVVAGASRPGQAEPDGPASPASQPAPRSAPGASEAPNRHPGGRAQITPLCAQRI